VSVCHSYNEQHRVKLIKSFTWLNIGLNTSHSSEMYHEAGLATCHSCGDFCYCKANWDVMITSTMNTPHNLPDRKITMPCLISVQHFIEQTQKIMKFMGLQMDRHWEKSRVKRKNKCVFTLHSILDGTNVEE
jgi:hypothetical protein